jgi:hypothetical protein
MDHYFPVVMSEKLGTREMQACHRSSGVEQMNMNEVRRKGADLMTKPMA